MGFALCVVVAFDSYRDQGSLGFGCKCSFETYDGDCNDIDCKLCGLDVDYKPRILCSDYVFLLYCHQLYANVVQNDHRFSIYQHCHKASFEFSPQDDDGWPLPNCKVKKCGVCLLLSEEEDRESGDSFNEESGDGFNEIERIGSRSNGGHSEEEDDQNTGRLKENILK